MVNKKHAWFCENQNEHKRAQNEQKKHKTKKVWNLQKAFSLRTIKICRFEIIDGVKYVYCIKHVYTFLLREQAGFAAVLRRLRQVFLVILL